MIMSLEEAVRVRSRDCMDATGEHFLRSVRPIYGSRDGSRAEPIGSCLLLKVGERKVLVTAAHILDATSTRALYVLGTAKTEPVQLLGELISTTMPTGGRRHDKLDIGFWVIPETAVYDLGDVNFFSEGDLCANQVSPKGRLYMAMGFPHSRNKRKVNNKAMTITPVLWKYSGSVSERPELCAKLGISGDDHLFLRYEKYLTNFEGQRVSSVNPQGLSGGAVFDLGGFDSISCYDARHSPVGMLSGMIIERKKNHQVLIAVKIQRIFDAVKLKYGQ